mgnify:CR=1 FL=1
MTAFLTAVLLVGLAGVESGIDAESPVSQCLEVLDSARRDVALVEVPETGTLCYGGPISPEGVAEAIASIDNWPVDQPVNLVVRTLGGNVSSALDLAEVATRDGRSLNTFVYKSCASSCANYWFLGATSRHVLMDSFVLFHGGMTAGFLSSLRAQLQEEQAKRHPDSSRIVFLERDLASFPQLMSRERALLIRSRLDPDFLAFFDQDDEFSRRRCRRNRHYHGVVFSPEFLAAHGIDTVENLGPQDRGQLDQLLQQRGGDPRSICWWSVAGGD